MKIAPSTCSIRCRDGYQLQYRAWRPEGTPRATIVFLNGVMSHSGWFQPLAGPLVRAGIALVGADRRGTGPNQEARGDAPSARALIDDVNSVADAEPASVPLHLAGWCWGAVLAIHAAAERTERFQSLLLLAPGLYPTAAVAARLRELEAHARSSPPEVPCLGSPIDEDMFTRGPYLERFIERDEQRCRRFSPRFHGVMTRMGMIAPARLGALRLPMLVVLAAEDRATDNAPTVRAFERLARAEVSIRQVQSSHGIQFDAPEELGRILVSWIEADPGAGGPAGRSDRDAHR
jgi:alpha-beta hydrolase superfamily lysophospholipase